MTIKVGINGFGRIGRCTLAHIAGSYRNDIEVIKVNATGPIETAAHLIKYDSIHGRYPGRVDFSDGRLNLGRGDMQMFSTYDMEALDWEGCDVVLECTGKFNDGLKARSHLERGAGKVLLRAAKAGTGIIAGGPMRAVFETLGVSDVVAKSTGSSNPYNMVRATFDALKHQVHPKDVAAQRGLKYATLQARRAASGIASEE